MVEAIEIIKQSFLEYIGTGSYMILFFISLIYVYIKEDNKIIRNLMWFSGIIFLVIMNPVFGKIILPMIGDGVYWRLFWCLPMGVMIAYVGTKVIIERNKIAEKILIGIAICLIIVLSGKCIFNNQNYVLATNWYKIPQEALEIARMIEADEEEDEKCAIVPETIVPYIRQYNAEIMLRYQRRADTYENEKELQLLNSGKVKELAEDCYVYGTNYVVFKKETVLEEKMEDYNFYVLGETANYILYKLK